MATMKDKNKQKAVAARWAAHPWIPIATLPVLEQMYTQNHMTILEIANALGCSFTAVRRALIWFKIPLRRAIPRMQIGAANSRWKGALAGYQAKHLRVQTLRGKPKKCEVCGQDDPTLMYDWANLSGNYDDPSDYKRMCRSCHTTYDKRVLNIKKMRKRGRRKPD